MYLSGPDYDQSTLHVVDDTPANVIDMDIQATRDGGAWIRTDFGVSSDLEKIGGTGMQPTPLAIASASNMAVLRNGNLVVSSTVFETETETEPEHGQVQIYSAAGDLLNTVELGHALNEWQVTALANGSFVVVYTKGDGTGLYHQVFDGSGAPVTSQEFFNLDFGAEHSVIGLPDGGYVVFAHENGNNGFAQRFDADGGIVGDRFTIGFAGEDCFTTQ